MEKGNGDDCQGGCQGGGDTRPGVCRVRRACGSSGRAAALQGPGLGVNVGVFRAEGGAGKAATKRRECGKAHVVRGSGRKAVLRI